MRVLVTGASGFIGGALARTLRSRGDTVLSASRRIPSDDTPTREHVVVDLGAPPARAFDRVPAADVIVHCAGLAAPGAALADPVAAFATNAVGTSTVLELARSWQCPVVFASSVYVYDGTPDPPWHEGRELAPRSPLGASKAAAELVARAYWLCYGVPSIALRLFTVYGPGSPAGQFIPSALAKIDAARASGAPAAFGDPGSIRDFVYIDDVVAAFEAALRRVATTPGHEIFNIASGEERSIGQAVESMLALMPGSAPQVRFDAIPLRADEPAGRSHHAASVERARDILGWTPRVTFDEGLRRTYEGMRGGSEGTSPS